MRGGKRFSEDVSDLLFTAFVHNSNEARGDVGTKMVEANGKVLGAGARFVVGGYFNAAFVIFEGGALNRGDSHSWGAS